MLCSNGKYPACSILINIAVKNGTSTASPLRTFEEARDFIESVGFSSDVPAEGAVLAAHLYRRLGRIR